MSEKNERGQDAKFLAALTKALDDHRARKSRSPMRQLLSRHAAKVAAALDDGVTVVQVVEALRVAGEDVSVAAVRAAIGDLRQAGLLPAPVRGARVPGSQGPVSGAAAAASGTLPLRTETF